MDDDGVLSTTQIVDAGGYLVSDEAAPSYWVLEDPDGNRCCICAPMVGRVPG